MIKDEQIELKVAHESQCEQLFTLITTNEQWCQYNGPYFPYEKPSREAFKQGLFKRLLLGKDIRLVTINDKPIGTVSYYWECESTRWLEVGIIIYDSAYWSHGIGSKALIPWISHLFASLEIERVGLTTWSGNPRMMACATKLGLQQEAYLRKVRYYQGEYFDSVKYGVLRDEWEDCHGK